MEASSARPFCLAVLGGALLACSRTAPSPLPLVHDAYLWQRAWSAEVKEAAADAPDALHGLRVLAVERSLSRRGQGVMTTVSVDADSLARSGREVVAVLRIDGSAPLDEVSLAEVVRVARAWRASGTQVHGVEIDHDCATAALPAYAAWLRQARTQLDGLALSMTALSTWVGSPALPDLLASVGDVVVQLHTIAAPVLFDPVRARRAAEAWSRATGRSFRIALPTYRARLRDGTELAADPKAVAAFLADLQTRPIPGLAGIVWFRLGNAADPNAWSGATLTAVMQGTKLTTQVEARLVAGETGALDVVLENQGNLDGEPPGRLPFSGDIDALDGVRGFAARGSSLVAQRPLRLRAGESAVVGYVRGKDIQVALP